MYLVITKTLKISCAITAADLRLCLHMQKAGFLMTRAHMSLSLLVFRTVQEPIHEKSLLHKLTTKRRSAVQMISSCFFFAVQIV